MPSRPLFIPLRSEYFNAFATGTKDTEWRRWGPRFNQLTLRAGRAVTLSKGYSGARLFGVITSYQCKSSDAVPAAAAIYGPGTTVVGIKIRLHRPARLAR